MSKDNQINYNSIRANLLDAVRSILNGVPVNMVNTLLAEVAAEILNTTFVQ